MMFPEISRASKSQPSAFATKKGQDTDWQNLSPRVEIREYSETYQKCYGTFFLEERSRDKAGLKMMKQIQS